MDKPNYYSIIPAEVRYSGLSMRAIVLYGEISSLCNAQGFCWASNSYFAELYGISEATVSVVISEIEKYGFIKREIDKKNGNERKIYLLGAIQKNLKTSLEKSKDPSLEKSNVHIKKNNINIYNNKKNSPKKDLGHSKIDFELAKYFVLTLIDYNPAIRHKYTTNSKQDKLAERMTDDFRKMREIDKCTPEQIKFVIDWLKSGSNTDAEFWQKNILSSGKLRKQFPRLVGSIKQKKVNNLNFYISKH